MTVVLLVPIDGRMVRRYPIHRADIPSAMSAGTAMQRRSCTPSPHLTCNGWALICSANAFDKAHLPKIP